jgi:transposase
MRYSNDMRKKVIELIRSGKKQTEIYKFLNISKSTIIRWYKRYKEIGNADYFVNKKSIQSNKINDLDKFKEFIDSNNDKSLLELKYLWVNYKGSNKEVSKGTIHYILRNKLNYTFKKNLGYILKEMRN